MGAANFRGRGSIDKKGKKRYNIIKNEKREKKR